MPNEMQSFSDFWSSGPGPLNPWHINGNALSYEGAVTVPFNVAGGAMGNGSFNVDTLYVKGVPVAPVSGTYAAQQVIFVASDLTLSGENAFSYDANTNTMSVDHIVMLDAAGTSISLTGMATVGGIQLQTGGTVAAGTITTDSNYGMHLRPLIAGATASFLVQKFDGSGNLFYATNDGQFWVPSGILNAQGGLAVTGAGSISGTLTSTQSGSPSIAFQAAAATNRFMRWLSGSAARWDAGVNNTAESGGNVGSDWFLTRYDDAGTTPTQVIRVDRSTGKVNLAGDLAVAGAATVTGLLNANGGILETKAGVAVWALNNTSTGHWKEYIEYQNNSAAKWQTGVDFNDSGGADFFLYDAVAAQVRASWNATSQNLFGSLIIAPPAGGVNTGLIQHDGSNMHIRTSTNQSLYLGANGVDTLQILPGGVIQALTGYFGSTVDLSKPALLAGRYSVGNGRAVLNTAGSYGWEIQVNGTMAMQLDASLLNLSGGLTAAGAVSTTGAVVAQSGTAVPAPLNTAGLGFMFSSVANFGITFTDGQPTVAMAKGTVALNRGGTGVNAGQPWVNTDGTSSGWASLGGGASISVGTTPPGTPVPNQLWWNNDASLGGGQMFIYYNDGNTTQWVPATPSLANSNGVLRLYSEQVLTGAASQLVVTIPVACKKIVLEYATFNTGPADDVLLGQVMQSGVPYTGTTYQCSLNYASQNTPTSSSGSSFPGFINVNGGGFHGEIWPVMNTAKNTVSATGTFCGLLANNSVLYQGTLGMSFVGGGVTPGTVTGFRLVNSGGTTFAAGSFLRCFVVT